MIPIHLDGIKDVRPALKSPADLVIYELHVRDFSISPTSGLKYKGKYLALTEPKAIEYLKNLGINAIHFQPVFDFASVDETQLNKPQFNWGYDPKNYNVPEGSYSYRPLFSRNPHQGVQGDGDGAAQGRHPSDLRCRI